MSSKDKILFIVNPISGTKGELPIQELIDNVLDQDKFEPEIYKTKSKGDAVRAAKEAANNGYKVAVAVGGDGTINEVAQGLVESQTMLGVIPRGSGNGFANYFNISKDPVKAISRINKGKTHIIDAGSLNNNLFLSVCGLGFDAKVSSEFDSFGTRGLFSYIWISFKEFFRFKAGKYFIQLDDHTIETDAFLVTVANSSQFGNDAYIAPGAQIDDGVLDVVVVKPLNVLQGIEFTYRLFTKSLHNFRKCTIYQSKSIRISHSDSNAQVDGEPVDVPSELNITIHPGTLKVLA